MRHVRNRGEIGSEFWFDTVPVEGNFTYVLSGRTALDLILQDMEKEGRNAKSVYMPTWCCDSMLRPFIDWGIEIKFYDVCWEKGVLKFVTDDTTFTDILYLTNYFGYDTTLPERTIKLFKGQGKTVIFDRTHSLFRNDYEICYWANYIFGSIRKWMGVVTGAYVKKRDREFYLPDLKECPYIKDKEEAMKLKTEYMSGNPIIHKQSFLEKYAQFGDHLAENYRNYKMDYLSQTIWKSADKYALQKKRKANAVYLHKQLSEIPQIKLMFLQRDDDCPLFVPILLESKEDRDGLRKHLTANAIYCPVHWPKPSIIDASFKANDIYDRELSLICDQRYGTDDMQRIIETIKEYYQ